MSQTRWPLVLAGLIIATQCHSARAQFPGVYSDMPADNTGAWWWSGDNSEGNIDGGMGAYPTEAGFYGYDSTGATAVDSQPIRGEDDDLGRQQQLAAIYFARRMAAEHERISRNRKAIDDRYRYAPTARDVERGDALNFAFRVLAHSSLLPNGSRDSGPRVPSALVRQLPLRYAAAAETFRLDRVKALPGLAPAIRAHVVDMGTDPFATYLERLDQEPETTIGQLLGFMEFYDLQFGVAETVAQRAAFRELYPHLAGLLRTIPAAPAAREKVAGRSR